MRITFKHVATLCALVAVNLVLFYFAQKSPSASDIFEHDAPFDDNDNTKSTIFRRTIPIISTTNIDQFLTDNRSKLVFPSLHKAQEYMRNISIENSPRVIIKYETFSRQLPKFISSIDKEIFLQSERNQEYLEPMTKELLTGVVEVVRNGTFQMDFTCGYKSNYDFVRKPRTSSPGKSYRILAPLIIPMGFIFQHFLDGTVPKIVQAFDFLRREDVKILLERPDHPNVYNLLDHLGITAERVVWHQRGDTSTVYHADFMIMACVAPPLHPVLFQKIRQLLGVQDELQSPPENAKIMLLTRAGAKLGGRNIINQPEVENLLTKRFGKRLTIFNEHYSLDEAISIFSKVKLVIGSHGGAFYNLLYSSVNTSVIEFGPVLKFGREIASLPHAIFWALSDLLHQDYWRMECISQNHQHDMIVDIAKLEQILDVIFSQNSTWVT